MRLLDARLFVSCLLLVATACSKPAAEARNPCPASDTPANALEAKVLAQTRIKASCDAPGSVCTYSIAKASHGDGLLVHVAFQQITEDGSNCMMAGDAVSSYFYDAQGRFVREAHGGLSAEFPAEDGAQPADAF